VASPGSLLEIGGGQINRELGNEGRPAPVGPRAVAFFNFFTNVLHLYNLRKSHSVRESGRLPMIWPMAEHGQTVVLGQGGRRNQGA
jgi:hypothetical protein